MKKFGRIINTLIITVGCALFLLACYDMLDFRAPKKSEDGEGTFSLVIGNEGASRTILPATGLSDNFQAYTLVFTQTAGGTDTKTVDRTNANLSTAVSLAVGTWKLDVTAYTDSGKTTQGATGTISGISITNGTNSVGNVALTPIASGTGTFSWSISNIPAGVTGTMKSGTTIDKTLSGTTATGTQDSITSGTYLVVFTLTNGTKTIVWEQYLHIYQNLTSDYTYALPSGLFPAPSLSYRISLSPDNSTNDPYVITTYPQTVIVSNTGTGATGALEIALSGTNASSFTLSKPSISDILASDSDNFTITPAAGISAGAHTATVTVSAATGNSNSITAQTFNVSFTATYGITLSEGATSPLSTLTFDAADKDATVPATRTVTVTNASTNNMATGALTAALSGADASAFTLNGGTAGASASISSIAVGLNDTFTVQPVSTSTATPQTYTATVTVSAASGNTTGITSQTFNVSFTVNPTTGAIDISFDIDDEGESISIDTVPATLSKSSTPELLSATGTTGTISWRVLGPTGTPKIYNSASISLDVSDSYYTSGELYSLTVEVTKGTEKYSSPTTWFTVTD